MALDFNAMTCHLIRQYQITATAGNLALSTSQGSTQIFDNGNVFIGWGELPYISEHTANGRLVMQGQFGADDAASSYRAFKGNWLELQTQRLPCGPLPTQPGALR